MREESLLWDVLESDQGTGLVGQNLITYYFNSPLKNLFTSISYSQVIETQKLKKQGVQGLQAFAFCVVNADKKKLRS